MAGRTRKGGWRCLSKRHIFGRRLVLISSSIIFPVNKRAWGNLQMSGHCLAGRLDMFREMAAEVRKDAARAASAEMKDGYERLSRSWDELIGEISAAMSENERPKQRAG
jgi:hypothetical protein